jgi:hypothetical protein
MQASAAAKKETQDKPKAYVYSLRAPYMKQGSYFADSAKPASE